MENASKALLIAGSILLVMLIIGLLALSWSKFSGFYSKNDDLAEIEDLSKFNLQFTNYQRNKVYGYELISLANRVADYNMRYSTVGKNDEKYNPITMKFTMTKEQSDKLQFNDVIEVTDIKGKMKKISADKLFKDTVYIQSQSSNQIVGQIFKRAVNTEEIYKSSTIATKLAKSINSLILSDTQLKYNEENRDMSRWNSWTNSLVTYNRIVNKENEIKFDNTDKNSIADAYEKMINTLINDANIMQYYEYYQFKRGIFECGENDITYDDVTGRVKSISFKFTGRIE